MSGRKKETAAVLLPILVCLAGMIWLNYGWQNAYQNAAYLSLSGFGDVFLENNPQLEGAFFASLKEFQAQGGTGADGAEILGRYGYTSRNFPGSEGLCRRYFAFAATAAVLMTAAFSLSVLYIGRGRRRRIGELTDYLERVNAGASGTLIQTGEDAFSHLQDEIYKTVTNLYVTREHAVKARQRFADSLADLAHQLKTPVTAALLSLQLMEKKSRSVYTESVGRQLRRLNDLEEALLTLSKMDSGTLQLAHSPVDIYTVLNLAAENLADLTAREEISIEIPHRECAQIRGDMEWTMEALINLMKNCMEHSPRGGVIHCDYSQNPLYTEIMIWDEGEGFDPEDIPHLFERFYRGKREMGTIGGGTGLGLALARSVFALQNGNLTARNLPAGGACFEIRVYSH